MTRLVVLGAARSGLAAAKLAQRQGMAVTVFDEDTNVLPTLMEMGIAASTGEWSREMLADVDAVVASPGIPQHHPMIRDVLESRLPLWSELEFSFRFLDAPFAAVTGTNGKTTVTAVLGAMLSRSGLESEAVGNIGLPLADVADRSWDALAIEASSFQLRFIESFHPPVAVVLNVVTDHLDWHGSQLDYLQSKARIFENQTPEDVLVFDSDDPGAVALAARAPSQLVPVSGVAQPVGGWGPSGADLRLPSGAIPLAELPDAGRPFLVDVTAAAVAADRLGASSHGIESAIREFEPVPHRRELVTESGGVRWVNDSKATNPHAALAALDAFGSVVLIAGGRNKGLDLGPVVRHEHVRHVLALGEAADELVAPALEADVRVAKVQSMAAAVDLAAGIARPGDVVLLSPGCASFDMYESYEERGDDFRTLARASVSATREPDPHDVDVSDVTPHVAEPDDVYRAEVEPHRPGGQKEKPQ